MTIDGEKIKKLRTERHWSQEQLSEVSGLGLRTIQRMEGGSNASMASVKILAEALGVQPEALTSKHSTDAASSTEAKEAMTPKAIVVKGFKEYSNFSGKATRPEYWWFLLFIVLVMAVATLIHERLGMIVNVILLVPLLAAGSRRLNDAGQSPWWQLFMFVPFGQIVVFVMMAQPSVEASET